MTTFIFGKYKGKTIDEVIKSDPKYVKWAYMTISNFLLSYNQVENIRSNIEDRNSHLDEMDYGFSDYGGCSEIDLY